MLAPPGAATQPAGSGVRLRSIGGSPLTGTARAVVVEQGTLVYTALMYPDSQAAHPGAPGDATAQTGRVLDSIALALREARTSLDNAVRLQIYVADASVTPHVDRLLAQRFGTGASQPAVTFVETAMPRPGILVAMDAIAATSWTPGSSGATRLVSAALVQRTPRASHAALLPPSAFVALSGRAAPGDFEPAIRETLAQLRGDLQSVGLTLGDVVQIKSFLGDMRKAPQLEAIIADAFTAGSVPPQVLTEWRQNAAPAEIELVATGGPREGTALGVDHLEPIAGRYSRVAHAHGGRPIFVSGLLGDSPDPAAQVGEMFGELERLLQQSGSDIRHLVKATYYVSDAAADDRINTIRPTLYDPLHPPAASKLFVRGTARPGKATTFDMIAMTSGR
jgi:enamine deaminase RidA (YjgF/YER057c/UK114 family)